MLSELLNKESHDAFLVSVTQNEQHVIPSTIKLIKRD